MRQISNIIYYSFSRSLTELESEINVLRTGLKDIEKELEHHRNLPSQYDGKPDKFVTVMKNFVTVAAYNFSELEDSLKEMKTKVRKDFSQDPTWKE